MAPNAAATPDTVAAACAVLARLATDHDAALQIRKGGILPSGPGCGRGCHVVWYLLRVGRRAEAKARCDPSAAHPPASLPSTRTPSFLSCTRPAAAPPV
eukprot:scaffold18286_cov55-Isochrysis_galbana.AAC.1